VRSVLRRRASAAALDAPSSHNRPEDPIRIRSLIDAIVAAILLLIALNAVLWHLVFPDGLLENYTFLRPSPLVGYELAGIIATALLLVTMSAVSARALRGWRAAAFGGLLGMLTSLPAQLLNFAVVRSDPRREIFRVLWTVASWAITSAAIGWFLNRRNAAT
jgi:hypothetical protein